MLSLLGLTMIAYMQHTFQEGALMKLVRDIDLSQNFPVELMVLRFYLLV